MKNNNFRPTIWVTKIVFYTLVIFCLNFASVALGKEDCGNPFVNAYGPYDYTNPEHYHRRLPIVEHHHFEPAIQKNAFLQELDMLPRDVVGDLDYTLRAFPNHHRVLLAVSTYLSYMRKYDYNEYKFLIKRFRTIDCYFQRATKFKPGDGTVYAIYGIYLMKEKEFDDALEKLHLALKYQPDNSEINYNIGLAYYKQKKVDEAYKYAVKAYELGYPLPFLKNEFKKLGKWDIDDKE